MSTILPKFIRRRNAGTRSRSTLNQHNLKSLMHQDYLKTPYKWQIIRKGEKKIIDNHAWSILRYFA